MGTRTAARSKAKAKRKARYQRAMRNRAGGSRSPIDLAAELCQPPGAAGTSPFPADCSQQAASCGQLPEDCSSLKQVAAAALILGQNVTKTAQALGVDRRTVQRWGKFDPEFHEVLAETKLEVVVTSRQSLLALAESAVEKVETKLNAEQNPRIALAFLRGIGALTPAALTTPAEKKQESENENRAQSATFGAATAAEVQSAAAVNGEELDKVYELADLVPEQRQAVLELFRGKSIAEVAHNTHTTPETIRHWLCHEIGFFTVLSEMQLGRILHLKFRLLNLLQTAEEIVRNAIAAGDGRVALALLRGLGLMR